MQMYRQHEQKDRNARINIKPEIPQKKKIKDQYKLVKELARSEYDKVFWIVDLDVIVKETNDYYKNYQEVLGELRVHLKGYDKTRKYFMRPGKDIYRRLKPYLKDAIKNAGELGEFDEQNPTKANCEMDVLFKN